ncbi:hypothetical protein ACHAXS_008852 [Conticribra weissflogii]
MHTTSDKSSLHQMGMGVPQNLLRLTAQSLASSPRLFDDGDQGLVGFLDVDSGHFGNLRREHSVGIDGTGNFLSFVNDVVGETDAVIVFSEGRCLMDDSGAGVVRDVVIAEDAEVVFAFRRGGGIGEVVEEGFVLLADQVRPDEGLFDGVEFRSHGGFPFLFVVHDGVELRKTRLCENVSFLRFDVEYLNVGHGGVDAQGEVGGKRPRGGGPRHETDLLRGTFAGAAVLVQHGKTDHHRRIPDILVVQARLEVAQGRPARRAEGHDLVPLVHQALLEQLLEDPPHALHEGRVHRLVVVLEVDPPPQPRHGPLPLLRVPRHDPPTGLVVLVHAHFQDLIAMGDVELLVDLVLHGEAVAVPAGAARDVAVAHAGVAGDDVFDGAGEDVAVVGQAGGEGGAVVEGVFLGKRWGRMVDREDGSDCNCDSDKVDRVRVVIIS